jgi:hypothetical protein
MLSKSRLIKQIAPTIYINKYNLSSFINKKIKTSITDIESRFNCCAIGVVNSPYIHKFGI